MDIKKRNWAIAAMMLSLFIALSLTLVACGGESSNQKSNEQEAASSETPEDQKVRYLAGYDEISDNYTISNPDPLTYEYVRDTMGDEGTWVFLDEETSEWKPFDGTPTPGEEATLEYAVEGENGAVLVMWSTGKNYETETFSSISNTLERE
ncbi:MAG: hypothetical protein ACOYD7_06905 [Raoultibacter sp.]